MDRGTIADLMLGLMLVVVGFAGGLAVANEVGGYSEKQRAYDFVIECVEKGGKVRDCTGTYQAIEASLDEHWNRHRE